VLSNAKEPNAARIAVAKTLGELGKHEAVGPMVAILQSRSSASLKRGILQAAARFEDRRIAEALLTDYETHISGDKALREDALRVLAGRKEWAVLLASFVNQVKVPAQHVTWEVARQLALHDDPEIQTAIDKHWKTLLAVAPTAEKQREMQRLKAVVQQGLGDLEKGRGHFAARCALCHKLFEQGASFGPELTGYDRGSLDFWMDNLFNPSLEIREGYGAYIVRLKNGQVLTGLMDAQDAAGLVLKDMAGNKTAVKQAEVESLQASPVSLMPEGLLAGLSDAELRDFFAYLMRQP
jgi:putative heme-binding domain-containing protein